MKLTIVVLSTIVATLCASNEVDERVIGGKKTTIEEHPYQVSLRFKDEHYCGGSIVNENTIITAAHCVRAYDYDKITVRMGSTIHYEGEEFKPSEIKMHPKFNHDVPYNNDIAVLKFKTAFKFSDKVQPIELQPEGVKVEAGTTAYVTGWGSTFSEVHITPNELYVVDVEVISIQQCQQDQGIGSADKVTTQMLCAKSPGHRFCGSDSGGPLVANGKLIGLVSWGGYCDSLYPGVYVNISKFHEFIGQY